MSQCPAFQGLTYVTMMCCSGFEASRCSAVQGMRNVTMFCGDGINDLAALTAADIGFSIGTTDAVIAAEVSTNYGSVAGRCRLGSPLVSPMCTRQTSMSFACDFDSGYISVTRFRSATNRAFVLAVPEADQCDKIACVAYVSQRLPYTQIQSRACLCFCNKYQLLLPSVLPMQSLPAVHHCQKTFYR